ncbi:chemotaxis protein [Bradyrhizobium ontarionense]|uniref:Chemotaxis protein n=1 Tax=Bradyrhizobium ontarionense TaxID=2898149 RepID=A0ABY3RJY2_9BRAD|nr:chemotaxis protein [Bradyrhizobium sp. A19]UFZ07163.1 chemotaxis protein [Bradyrhizobium sp. A19]
MDGILACTEEIAAQIEATFAQMGRGLGRGHVLFDELNAGLASLSQELSGDSIAGASSVLRDVAARLARLLEVLRSEGDLLGTIGASAEDSASILKLLVKHIKMVLVIAQNARIEAASLGSGQDGFLNFTQEAVALAKAVEGSIEACSVNQTRLAEAVATALRRQRDFETRYRDRFRSVGADLVSAHAALQSRRTNAVRLAASAGAGTRKITEAVGSAIVSLQAGDSTRQRLEHVGRALRIADGLDHGLAPAGSHETGDGATIAGLIRGLQSEQLTSAASDLDSDLGDIDRSLSNLLSGATEVVGHGRALAGTDDGTSGSFLTGVKQALAEASSLIKACDDSRRSVDNALSVVDDMLGNFRSAVQNLSDAVTDIILVGMNAGLKARQVGIRGRAFVVIANELRATADKLTGGAAMLKPILDAVERAASELARVNGDSASGLVTELEPRILSAIRGIESESDQIGAVMTRLIQSGGEFDGLISEAKALLGALRKKSAWLPEVARSFTPPAGARPGLAYDDQVQAGNVFDGLYAQYTMASERGVHLGFLQRVGLAAPSVGAPAPQQGEIDEALFF